MSPYGVAKEMGGDSPENTAKMERCVKSVLSNQGHMTEESAIRICKDSLSKAHKKAKG